MLWLLRNIPHSAVVQDNYFWKKHGAHIRRPENYFNNLCRVEGLQRSKKTKD